MFLSSCLLAMLPAANPVGQFVTASAPTPDGKMLFVAMKGDAGGTAPKGFVCVWDLTKPELKAVVPVTPTDVRVIQPTTDGKRFVLLCGNGWQVTAIEVYDTTTKKLLHTFNLLKNESGVAVVSPDGNWVAYRRLHENLRRDPGSRVWNTETGESADAVGIATRNIGVPVFSSDSKRLILVSLTEVTEIDLKTAEKTGGWKREEPADRHSRFAGGTILALPNGKGMVSVSPTGKRRQSYAIRISTKKQDWEVGEFWDYATTPIVSPDGRLLIVSGGVGPNIFTLKLDVDSAPELEDRPEKPVGPWVPGLDKKVPAWREWPVVEAKRAVREYLGPMSLSPDGKRLFIATSEGVFRVYDTERRELKATFFTVTPKKDEAPPWHILTTTGEMVGSPQEVQRLVSDGKKEDAAKVKAALGVK